MEIRYGCSQDNFVCFKFGISNVDDDVAQDVTFAKVVDDGESDIWKIILVSKINWSQLRI